MEMMLSTEDAKNVWAMAANLAKSKMIPYSLAGKTEDVFAIMLMGHELNIAPMTSLQNISVIQGRPTVSPQMMLGMIYRALPEALIRTEIDEKAKVVKVFGARSLKLKEYGYTATWDENKAGSMGLLGKDNYKKQLVNMLKWRATAEMCRVVFSDIIMGLYLPMEFEDVDGKELPEIKTVQQELDESHPIPEEEAEMGSENYRVQYDKFRGKQLKDIDTLEIESRIGYLEKQAEKGDIKPKYDEELRSMMIYMTNLDIVDID